MLNKVYDIASQYWLSCIATKVVLDTLVHPSDEESGKETNRQKSEPTTPISTSSRPPNEYDEVMGITQMDSREAERFEEGIEPLGDRPDSKHASGAPHRGYGSSSLQECLDILNQARINTFAPCHSRAMIEESSNPQHAVAKFFHLDCKGLTTEEATHHLWGLWEG